MINDTNMSVAGTGKETVQFSDAAIAILSVAKSSESRMWIQEWPRVVVSIGAPTLACSGIEELSVLHDSVFAS